MRYEVASKEGKKSKKEKPVQEKKRRKEWRREEKKRRKNENKGIKMNVETEQYFGQKVSLPYKKVEDAFQ